MPSNVSYSTNAFCKSLCVPLLTDAFEFGTAMKDPIWQRAVHADDFERFPTGGLPKKSTQMCLFRDTEALYFGFFCQEAPEDRVHADMSGEASMYQLWSGDMVELHFGEMDPDPWKLQLCIGIDGQRFDSTGTPDGWEAKCFANDDGWGAEVRLPLALFELSEGGLRFNFCRQALKRGEYSVWSHVDRAFHETENYGELLFADYDTIACMRGGSIPCGTPLSRQAFEELRKTWEVPADSLTHGPVLLHPDHNAVTISFQSAGNVAAFVECTRTDVPNQQTRRFECGRANGYLLHEKIHTARLAELAPGGEYLCQPYLLTPTSETPHAVGQPIRFRMLAENSADFSFVAFNDLHSDVNTLRKFLQLPQTKQADFLLDMGDNLSGGFGITALNTLLVDTIATEEPKPLALAKGNHEQIGIYANDYDSLFKHPSGRTWYAFRAGCVHFTILDSGNDHPDATNADFFRNDEMRAQEIAFQKDVVRSDEYLSARFRVLVVHIPPTNNEVDIMKLIEPMREAQTKPDVMLSGHMHDYARLENGAFAATSAQRYLNGTIHAQMLPFPLIVNATNTALHCRVTENAMQFSVLLPDGEGNATLKDFLSVIAKSPLAL
ncbi:MAG: metallophosphoesterase [Lentisphaeria bacterium]|nr:metallophosphoesterase [Lentisphaeria bacterium]